MTGDGNRNQERGKGPQLNTLKGFSSAEFNGVKIEGFNQIYEF